MNVVIFSDDQAGAERLRSALAEHEIVCPIDRVFPLAAATSSSATYDAQFVVLLDDETSLTVLEELCARGAPPVIAVGTASDPRFIMRVVHAGPADYLDIDGDLTRELARALNKLKPAERIQTAPGKVVSVFSHSGGSGCSLLATNLAVALAEKNGKCLLCDFNVRRGDLATLLNLKPDHTVNDVTKSLAKLQRDIFKQALTPHASGVQLLAAPTSLSDVRPIPVEASAQIVGLGRRTFPHVIIDLEDFFHHEQFEVLRQSDSTLFVMRLDYTALRNARRTFEYLDHEGIESSKFKLVINQHGRPRELTAAQAEEVLGRSVDYFVPFDPKTTIEAMNRGVPIIQYAPRATMTRAIRKIADELNTPAAKPVTA